MRLKKPAELGPGCYLDGRSNLWMLKGRAIGIFLWDGSHLCKAFSVQHAAFFQ